MQLRLHLKSNYFISMSEAQKKKIDELKKRGEKIVKNAQNQAATKIQKGWKGGREKKKMSRRRRKQSDAAEKIQARWRGH